MKTKERTIRVRYPLNLGDLGPHEVHARNGMRVRYTPRWGPSMGGSPPKERYGTIIDMRGYDHDDYAMFVEELTIRRDDGHLVRLFCNLAEVYADYAE